MDATSTEWIDGTIYHRIRRSVARDLRRRYRLRVASLTDEQRQYLADESQRYALALCERR
jgi:hypothetical protein